MKKLLLITLLSLLAVLSGCKKSNTSGDNNTSGSNVPVIGIAKLLPHPALNAVEQGIQDELKEQNINVTYDLQNANAEVSFINSIATKFKTDNVDIAVGIGTPMALALYNTIQNRPIVFSAITDPVSAKLMPSKDKGGKNITGVSDAVNVEEQLNNFRKIVPFKKLGLIYTNSEDNSIAMYNTTKEVCEKLGVELISQAITNISEIKQAAQSLVDRVDAFYVVTDNNVCSSLGALTDTAAAKNIPVFSSDPASSMQFGGVLYTVGADYYTVGRLTGKQIIEILNGKKTEDMPTRYVQGIEETKVIIDANVVKALNVTIPQELIPANAVFLNQ